MAEIDKILSTEDLQKLKHWVEKRIVCKSPHCGERCILLPANGVTPSENKG